jgi:hypothetical protein
MTLSLGLIALIYFSNLRQTSALSILSSRGKFGHQNVPQKETVNTQVPISTTSTYTSPSRMSVGMILLIGSHG